MVDDNKLSQNKITSACVSSKKQFPLVFIIIFLALTVSLLLYFFKPEADKIEVQDEPPLAEFIIANVESIAVPVASQGSIKAKIHIKLVAEVSGRVTRMAKLKFDGGFFKKGDLLLSIDETDYRLAISRAKAQVAAARQQLVRAETEAGQAKYDLRQIGRDPSKSTSYALREPQLAEARANLQAAQADLKISELQMQRTTVSAPFDGRVVSKQVDIGQYVSAGTLLADIYSTESVTVRLPLSLRQTELLGIKLRNNQQLIQTMKINLIANSTSKKHQWMAKFSHTEGEIDVRNRLVYLVAEVDSPYVKKLEFIDRPPLTPGMFVKAEITGLEQSTVKLPRSALRYDENVWLLDELNQLQKTPVEILNKDRNYIYVKTGLSQGDRVIINSIDFPLNGMKLSPLLINSMSSKTAKISHE